MILLPYLYKGAKVSRQFAHYKILITVYDRFLYYGDYWTHLIMPKLDNSSRLHGMKRDMVVDNPIQFRVTTDDLKLNGASITYFYVTLAHLQHSTHD